MLSARTPGPDAAIGVDTVKVAEWMSALSITTTPPLTFALAGQGKSNITAIISDAAGRRWVLRRPPLGNLLPTAHDVAREYRILSALHGTRVPVPHALGLTTDDTITDAPLMLMEHIDGYVIDEMDRAEALTPAQRGPIGPALIEALAAVHAVDLEQAGLADLASHRPFAARQLKRWRSQWESSRTHDEPRIEKLADRLEDAMPAAEELSLIHGDYHLRNAIFDPNTGQVRALIDWELSTLGDPIADLGLLLAYWPEAGDPPGQYFTASALPGFARRADLVQHYGDVTGRDTSTAGFWEILGLWKVAVILEGVRRRALDDPRNAARGAMVDLTTIDALVGRAWARASAVGL